MTDSKISALTAITAPDGTEELVVASAGTSRKVTVANLRPKIYFNKPAANITRAATTVGAFSTPWQITGVVVAAGQNIKLRASLSCANGTNNDYIIAFFRNSTQIAAKIFNVSSTTGIFLIGPSLDWIDENPGPSTYTYEVRAAQFVSGTLTVYQTNVTTDVAGGSSIFIAEVYTP